jgi:hypothetical protein
MDNDTFNQRSLPLLYREVLVSRDDAFELFDKHNLAYVHPSIKVHPVRDDLQKSANFLIKRSANRAAFIGATTGAIGYPGVIFEMTLLSLHFLRLGQRLIALYGHDPRDEFAEALVLKAFAHIFEFELNAYELPKELTDLRPFIQQIQHKSESEIPSTKWLVTKTAVRYVFARHFKRLIPAIGSSLGAFQSHRTFTVRGNELNRYIERQLRPKFQPNTPLDAVEIRHK